MPKATQEGADIHSIWLKLLKRSGSIMALEICISLGMEPKLVSVACRLLRPPSLSSISEPWNRAHFLWNSPCIFTVPAIRMATVCSFRLSQPQVLQCAEMLGQKAPGVAGRCMEVQRCKSLPRPRVGSRAGFCFQIMGTLRVTGIPGTPTLAVVLPSQSGCPCTSPRINDIHLGCSSSPP